MARPEGLEPPAYWFEANRSIQLSYGRGSKDRDLMVSKLEFRRRTEFRMGAPGQPEALRAILNFDFFYWMIRLRTA